MSSPAAPSIDITQAQRIIDFHFGGTDDHLTIAKLVELENQGYSHTPDLKTYVADLHKPGSSSLPVSSCFLTISHPTPTISPVDIYPRPSLPLIAHLVSLIRKHTDIPIRESTLNTSLNTVPFHYLLSPLCPFLSHTLISLPRARAAGLLSPQAELRIELLIGQFLGQLHSGVQNDWYGLPILGPGEGGGEERYSWQETFTGLLDRVLTELQEREDEYALGLNYSDVHRYLSRAIASFLFDDVEVPSLVWLTGSEHDIYVTLPSPSPTSSSSSSSSWFSSPTPTPTPGTIAAILPNVAHALWGDPLLESLMMGPVLGDGPSRAFMEGYAGGGGGPVLVFARQKTKRVWYTLFLAGVILLRYGPGGEEKDGNEKGEEEWITEKRRWARDVIGRCVEYLRDAPCY